MIPLKNTELLRDSAYCNGQWVGGVDGKYTIVSNPATNEPIGRVPQLTEAHIQRVVRDADVAFQGWKKTTAKFRAEKLRRWFELVVDNVDDLAVILTSEQGKPLHEARAEILYAASFIEWFAEEGKRAYGDVIPSPSSDNRLLVVKEPVGVCAAITPWNFPAAMITRKVAPALAAGCSIIVRPADLTPLTALALAVLAEQAGFPAGVFNVVTGSSRLIGGVLTESPVVRKLSFTGSTSVGRMLMGQCANTLKKLSLELGGNAPFIVFEDADIDAAVAGAVASKYRNTGQTCVCTNRFYVHDAVYTRFSEKLALAVSKLKVGNGLDEGTNQGPLIDSNAVLKVEQHVENALAGGARLVCGGRRLPELGENYYEPTVLVDVNPAMQVTQEETFGPLSALIRFSNESEVLDMANDTEYGLASYVYTNSIGRAWRVAEALEAGMVGINTGLISNEVAPFGGVKQSGFGREGSHYGLDEYLVLKYLCIGGVTN